MNKFFLKTTASLFLVFFGLIGSASAAFVITSENTNSATAFTPAWTAAPSSLIAGASPASSIGDFQLEAAGGLSQLTDGVIAPASSAAGFKAAFATAGNAGTAGHEIIYTLPVTANGYNVTNITVYSGWGDNGRDAQAYNVSYSTVANPTTFISLGYVNYNPAIGGSRPTANRVILSDSFGGVIAANVAAVRFNFTAPAVENGYAGYSEITIEGSAASGITAAPIVITTENQPTAASTSPTWVIETDNLVAGQVPASQTGNFQLEAATGTSALTDGVFGTVETSATYATGGNNGGGTLIYALTSSPNGSSVTNIVVYSGWGNYNRDGQFYNVSYSTVTAPTTFVPLTSVFYNPEVVGQPSANRVSISRANGAPLASNVANIKFDFTPQTGGVDNGYTGYAEIVLQGTNSSAPTLPPSPYLIQDTLPGFAADVVGGQVIFTAAYSNSPASTYQWQQIVGNVTNDIAGANSPTLVLNNVQLSNAGAYQLKAVNATNNLGVSYSTPSSLVVTNVPTPVNNIIVSYAAQTGLGQRGSDTNFSPTWTVASNSLIAGAIPIPGAGDFGLGEGGGDPAVLTDGTFGYLPFSLGNASYPAFVTLGVGLAGRSVTYTLPDSAAGWDLTNIVVYGGWGDAGRDQQKYEVLYSTVAAPSTFNQLAAVDYNPSNPNAVQSFTRATIRPVNSALVKNVAAVMFNFYLQGAPPENGYEGYSEIVVAGIPSAPAPILAQDITPVTASDVVGSQLTLTAAFSSDTPITYQWQKNGTNLQNSASVSGAQTTTLTLSNLQLTDTATNGGYSLVASNASGNASSRACALTVNPVPAANGNVIAALATQTHDGALFSPTWTVPSGSLIANQSPSDQGVGTFIDVDGQAGGVGVLTDGSFGFIDTSGAHPSFATGGANAGQFVTYTLSGSGNGYSLTNIMISGGWNDAGRDQQAYTVYYSTIANPAAFIPLTSINFNPVLPGNVRSLVRETLTPASGVLAANVAALKVDFTNPPGENGYSGYNEISLLGFPSGPLPVTFNPATFSNGNLVLSGTGGTASGSYTVVTATNIATPAANWTTVATGSFDSNGAFSNSLPIDPSKSANFFRIRVP